MSFPAFEAFAADTAVRHITFRVYMHLQRACLNHHTPQEVKSLSLAETLKLRPASIISALNWLTSRGYLVEHPRGSRNVRSFTLAWSIPPTISRIVHV